MRSRTSFFNPTVFRKSLSRYWPLWVLFAGVLAFALPFSLSNTLSYHQEDIRQTVISTVYSSTDSFPIIALLFGLAVAAATFDFLFTTRGTGLIASLPVKREAVFLSCYAAGAVMMLSAVLLAGAMTLVVEAANGAVHWASLITWMGALALQCLTFYSIAVFCAMLTGHVLILPCLYVLVNFGAPILQILLDWISRLLIFGSGGRTAGIDWLHLLSPCVQLISHTGPSYPEYEGFGYYGSANGFAGWSTVLIYFAAGVALAVCALLIFRRRRMESAQDTVSIPWLRPVLKYIVTAYCALGFPLFVGVFFNANLYRRLPMFLLLVAVGAVIGYLISEMIIQKSVRFKGKSWKGLLVAVAACCLVITAMRLDVFGYVRRVPQPEQVEKVWLYVDGMEFDIKNAPEAIEQTTELHRSIIDNRDVHESDDMYGYGTQLTLEYTLKNGSVITRVYPLSSESDDLRALEALLNSPGVMRGAANYTPQVPVTVENISNAYCESYLTEDEGFHTQELAAPLALELFENGIRPDIEAGAFNEVHLFYDEAYENTLYDAQVWIDLEWYDNNNGGYHMQSLSYQLSEKTVNTNAWLEEHGIHVGRAE